MSQIILKVRKNLVEEIKFGSFNGGEIDIIIDSDGEGDYKALKMQLYDYFNLKLDSKDLNIPVNLSKLSDLSLKVLIYLRENVVMGRTITYGELGNIFNIHPRKVGIIMRMNPYPLFFPCHRVVGKYHIGGFSGKIEWKKFLLRREGVYYA